MTTAPAPISRQHSTHRLPHLRLRVVLRVALTVLLALAILLLIDGDSGESVAVGAAAGTSVAGWALAYMLSGVGSSRAGVWVIGKVISPFQRWVIRTTDGRVTLTSKPVLLLTALGRRSGRPRTVPLLYLRDDGNLIVCNVRPPWERRNPWPLNVRANPEVTVRISGVAEPRIARDAHPDEMERL